MILRASVLSGVSWALSAASLCTFGVAIVVARAAEVLNQRANKVIEEWPGED